MAMNKKILVIAGTQDGRELAGHLLAQGYEVTASVVSQYGEELLKRYKGIKVNDKPLDEEGLVYFMAENSVEVLVDASHPYAVNASQNAMNACHRADVPYIRYERQQSPLDYKKAHYVADYAEAAQKAAELGKNIFLTTGSRNLQAFAHAECLQDCNVVCRVLPEAEVVAMCRDLGFSPAQIIAMQGPFSKELNREMYRKYQADVVITKNSGQVGGTDTKIAATMELGLPLIIIDRPKVRYDKMVESFEEILELLK